jgi:hypothetical protein
MAFFGVRLKTPLVHVASLVLALFAATAAASTRDVGDDERRMKPVFVYKFVPYVAWPAEAAAVRFEVSLPAAEARRPVISSRLLKVAGHVRTGNP